MKIYWNLFLGFGLGATVSFPFIALSVEKIHWLNWGWFGIGVASLIVWAIAKLKTE